MSERSSPVAVLTVRFPSRNVPPGQIRRPSPPADAPEEEGPAPGRFENAPGASTSGRTTDPRGRSRPPPDGSLRLDRPVGAAARPCRLSGLRPDRRRPSRYERRAAPRAARRPPTGRMVRRADRVLPDGGVRAVPRGPGGPSLTTIAPDRGPPR